MIRLILYGAWALWPPIVVAGQNASSESVSGSPIRWELIERFPLLSPQVMDRLDRARRDGEFEGTRAGPVSAIQLFRWFESGWRPGQPILADPASTAYDSASGRYKRSYVAQRGDRVGALFRLVKPGQAGARCSWRILEPEPIATASGPCGDGVALDIPLELAVEVEVTVLGGDASELFRETVEARQHVVVAMGDSYASGEGNPDIPAQYSGPMPLTPGADWLFNRDRERNVNAAAQWWDKECHRSLVSWPVLAVLTRALNDSDRHTQFRLLTYACSGAELVDGVLLAQMNPPGGARSFHVVRDGDPSPLAEATAGIESVRRSQVNAMFDDLCADQARLARLVHVSGVRPVRAEVRVCDDPIPVDEFMLSIGGNDVGFGSMALGVLVPAQAREGILSAFWLKLFRSVMGASSLDNSLDTVRELQPHYPKLIKQLVDIVGVRPEQASLMSYPNPVGQDKLGCVDGDNESSDKRLRQAERYRIRDVNLVLGKVLPRVAFGAGDGWTVEISTSEVEKFSPVFQTISEMQGAAEALGIRVTQFAEKGDFAGRRVCDRQLDARAPVMPLHFCGGYKDECSLCDLLKGEWCPSSAAGWHHYGPDRRMVYFLNDSILALRPWLGVEPTRAELLQSMKGSMHPTARAHAVAAQNLNCRLDVRVCVSTAGAFDSAQED